MVVNLESTRNVVNINVALVAEGLTLEMLFLIHNVVTTDANLVL
jgi:hypothetical protein